MTGRVAAVVIGRNEGSRLLDCLHSLTGQVDRIVYVDSGSTDGSVAAVRQLGHDVVELSADRPFTAARGRNAGFDALAAEGLPEFVQFLDGDCRVMPGWVQAGLAALAEHPDIGMVTGWRSEVDRDRSIYNALCDVEWRRPAGDIVACGGDMLVRAPAWQGVGGMNETVIAAEDDELCVRLAKAGWRLHRLPIEMTRHDAAMTVFGQWWQRAVRSGHGFAQVGHLHPEYFVRERRRVWFWGMMLPLAGVIGAFWSIWWLFAALGLYGLSWFRTARGLQYNDGLASDEARRHAVLLTLSKFPNLLGMIRFHLRRASGRAMKIIEYK